MGYAARSLGLRIYQYIVFPMERHTAVGVDETFYKGLHNMTGADKLFYSFEEKRAAAVDSDIIIKINGNILLTQTTGGLGYTTRSGYLDISSYSGDCTLEIYFDVGAAGSLYVRNLGMHGVLS